ncbi:MAG: polyhydroxyalkanoic acid system family protein [Candidatus Wildermuthbacteria bacterium]|nr:polyhydroxyalkanoic acid system family protein [Candidatus Wildermuthbacteria bacterium]
MPKLKVVLPHRLSQEEVLRRIRDLLPQVQRKYEGDVSGLSQRWEGNTGIFSFQSIGGKVSGTLTIRSAEVELSANLPFAAHFIKGRIERTITEQAKVLLA